MSYDNQLMPAIHHKAYEDDWRGNFNGWADALLWINSKKSKTQFYDPFHCCRNHFAVSKRNTYKVDP